MPADSTGVMLRRLRPSLRCGLLLIGVCGLVAAADAGGPRYVAARSLYVSYRVADRTPQTLAELWVSTDSGRTWTLAATQPAGKAGFTFEAPRDGAYELLVQLRESPATSTSPPPGAEPTLRAVVDTVPPLVQIHEQVPARAPDAACLRATIIEEQLDPASIHVFTRGAADLWVDGGVATWSPPLLCWVPAARLEADAEVRVAVVDLAGNRTLSEPLQLAPPASASQPTTQPATTQPVATTAPAAPPEVSPLAGADALRLHDLAQRFMAESRWPLAAARLEDTLALTPSDPNVLVDLGTVLYRLGQPEAARARFQQAHTLLPTHAGALDGLALVSAAQRQYADARIFLRAYLRVRPDEMDAWLRLGDIEHRLGDTRAALEAWQRVANSNASPDAQAQAARRLAYFRR